MTGAIVLAAGGTGGHVFPALALAAELALRGRQPALITDRRGDRYCAAYAASGAHKFGTHVIRAGTLSARGPFGSLKGLFDILAGTSAARRLLGRLDAGAVVGFGGYPSLPTMLAALRAGLPTLIHEQNAVLGRVNRRLARRVMAIALSFPETRGLGAADQPKTTLTGTPVRAEIAAIGQRDYDPPRDDGPLELLVIGADHAIDDLRHARFEEGALVQQTCFVERATESKGRRLGYDRLVEVEERRRLGLVVRGSA